MILGVPPLIKWADINPIMSGHLEVTKLNKVVRVEWLQSNHADFIRRNHIYLDKAKYTLCLCFLIFLYP